MVASAAIHSSSGSNESNLAGLLFFSQQSYSSVIFVFEAVKNFCDPKIIRAGGFSTSCDQMST